MKKLFLSLIAVIVGTMGSYAQSDLVATLTHGSSLTTFTGATALSEAYTAAAEGDVITLSPGVFNAVDIEKAITVRGAGMVGLESNGYVSTQITGEMTINVPSSSSSVLTIEGIHALGTVSMNGDNLAPINLIKCRFEGTVTGFGVNMNAISCIFASRLDAVNRNVWSDYKNTTFSCTNCVLINAHSAESAGSRVAKIIATNSLVFIDDNGGAGTFVLLNSIITTFYTYSLPLSCSAQNCLGINRIENVNGPLFANIINSSNVMADGAGTAAYSQIFKTLTMLDTNPSVTETYELTETAAATYLGNDGTQVGIYGGSYPFDPTPTNPQIKTFTVSNTTDGGTLKVKINVE